MSHINVSSTHPNSTPATRKRNSHVSALTPPNGSLSPTSALVSTPFRRKIKDIHFGGRKNPTPPVGRFRYLLQVKEGETLAELSKRMYDKLDTAMATDRDPAKKRLFVYDNCETTFKSITQKIDALTADNLAWREEMANKCLTWKHSLEDSMDNKMTTWKYTQACLRLPLVEGNTKQAVVKWAIGHQELWHHIKGLGVRGDDPTHSSVSSKHREIVRLFDDPKRFKDASSPAPNHLPFAYDPYFKSLFANCQTNSEERNLAAHENWTELAELLLENEEHFADKVEFWRPLFEAVHGRPMEECRPPPNNPSFPASLSSATDDEFMALWL